MYTARPVALHVWALAKREMRSVYPQKHSRVEKGCGVVVLSSFACPCSVGGSPAAPGLRQSIRKGGSVEAKGRGWCSRAVVPASFECPHPLQDWLATLGLRQAMWRAGLMEAQCRG